MKVTKMASKNTIQLWLYLIGKVGEENLSSENRGKLAKERAVKEAQSIVGEVLVKECWTEITGGDD